MAAKSAAWRAAGGTGSGAGRLRPDVKPAALPHTLPHALTPYSGVSARGDGVWRMAVRQAGRRNPAEKATLLARTPLHAAFAGAWRKRRCIARAATRRRLERPAARRAAHHCASHHARSAPRRWLGAGSWRQAARRWAASALGTGDDAAAHLPRLRGVRARFATRFASPAAAPLPRRAALIVASLQVSAKRALKNALYALASGATLAHGGGRGAHRGRRDKW